jgi:hypothetical protein
VVGYPLVAAGVVWVIYQAVRRRLSPFAAAGVLAAVGFWTATALARAAYGEPDASRYLYVSGAFILLVMATSLRPWRVRPYMVVAAAAAGAVIAVLGSTPLRGYATDRTTYDALVRAQLGAVQLAGPAAHPAYVIDHHLMGGITAGDWLGIVHDLGSNAFGPSKVRSMPLWYQLAADRTLIGAEGIRLQAIGVRVRSLCGRARSVRLEAVPHERSFARGTVLRVENLGTSAIALRLRRISNEFPRQPQLRLAPGRAGMLVFPRDAYLAPWWVLVTAASAGGLCVSSSASAAVA